MYLEVIRGVCLSSASVGIRLAQLCGGSGLIDISAVNQGLKGILWLLVFVWLEVSIHISMSYLQAVVELGSNGEGVS